MHRFTSVKLKSLNKTICASWAKKNYNVAVFSCVCFAQILLPSPSTIAQMRRFASVKLKSFNKIISASVAKKKLQCSRI